MGLVYQLDSLYIEVLHFFHCAPVVAELPVHGKLVFCLTSLLAADWSSFQAQLSSVEILDCFFGCIYWVCSVLMSRLTLSVLWWTMSSLMKFRSD
jgi:hypothetical protein